jgi:chromate reductase, NAD(P)H dehydrogenase (quinone)
MVITPPKILAFAGSTRKDSFNKKLLKIAAKAAENAGALVTVIDLAEWDFPIYDGDLESQKGIPDNAKKLKKIMMDHDAFLIASPEYNSSISGVLKNTIDWVSRPEPNEPYLAAFLGKTAAIMSASPGDLGGLRGLVHLRSILGNINVIVLPDQLTLNKANEAFDDEGSLKDLKKVAKIEDVVGKLVQAVKKLKA